jgi:hypothetical protein
MMLYNRTMRIDYKNIDNDDVDKIGGSIVD